MGTDDLSKLPGPFRALLSSPGLNFQFYDSMPVPVEVFAPDGTAVFINRAWTEMNNIPAGGAQSLEYNLKNDPVCLEILGQEFIDKIFRGEAVSFSDFPVPIQDAVDRGAIAEKPFEAATADVFMLPLWEGGEFVCTVCFFTFKNMYKDRADITRAREYIDKRWYDDFDIDGAARAAGLSRRHFQRVFKNVTGETPFGYYQNLKIKKIREKLRDKSLSVEKAFAECGVDSHGSYFRLFKEKTGRTPAEYRKTNFK